MTLKRRIWDFYVANIRNIFVSCKRNPHNNNVLNIDSIKNAPCCFITIAFNNEFLIEEQIRLIKKHIIDSNYIQNQNSKNKLLGVSSEK